MTQNTVSRNNRRSDDNFQFEICSHMGVLGEDDRGWSKEVNIVQWNGNAPKIDIRNWQPDHKRMSRGITLHEVEAARLAAILADRYGISKFPANANAHSQIQGESGMAKNWTRPSEHQNDPSMSSFYEGNDGASAPVPVSEAVAMDRQDYPGELYADTDDDIPFEHVEHVAEAHDNEAESGESAEEAV